MVYSKPEYFRLFWYDPGLWVQPLINWWWLKHNGFHFADNEIKCKTFQWQYKNFEQNSTEMWHWINAEAANGLMTSQPWQQWIIKPALSFGTSDYAHIEYGMKILTCVVTSTPI